MGDEIRKLLIELLADVKELITDHRDLITLVRQLVRQRETAAPPPVPLAHCVFPPAPPVPADLSGAKPEAVRAVLEMHLRSQLNEHRGACLDDEEESDLLRTRLVDHILDHFELKLKP